VIGTADLEALETAVGAAIRTGDASRLHLLGHGDISLALGWPADRPQYACKRLPPFDTIDAYTRYATVVERYIAELRRRGVRVVDTELQCLQRRDGRVIGFHIQPVLAPETLGLEILRSSPPSADDPFVTSVIDVVVGATHDRVGVDAQFSNWSWMNGEPWLLDLSTPAEIDEDGQPVFDMMPFLAALPAVIRPIVRSEMVKFLPRFLTPRGVLLDLAANAIKAGLDGWIEPVLKRINERVDPPVTRDEAMRIFKSDRTTFKLILRLERLNRFWQQRIRRRPYEFLLPENTTYGA
jgi:hypothetical protein